MRRSTWIVLATFSAALAASAAAARAECAQGRIPSSELRVEMLLLLDRAPDGRMLVTEIVDRLTERMAPCGEDLRLRSAGGTLFEAKIRSLAYAAGDAVATSLELRGLADYDGGPPATWRITASGREEVRAWRARLAE